MSYSSVLGSRENQTVAGSAADKISWDLTGQQGRAVITVTVRASANCTFRYRRNATAAKLASPAGGLHLESTESLVADVTKDILIAVNPACPVGECWLDGASGNYTMHVAARAHS